MDIKARIEELIGQQQALIQRQQEDGINIQRLGGAIAILNEQVAEEAVEEPDAEKAPELLAGGLSIQQRLAAIEGV